MVIFLLSDFVYQPADQEKEKETDYDGGTGGNIQKGRKEQSGNRTGGTDQGGHNLSGGQRQRLGLQFSDNVSLR